jgi:hypothetical protein
LVNESIKESGNPFDTFQVAGTPEVDRSAKEERQAKEILDIAQTSDRVDHLSKVDPLRSKEPLPPLETRTQPEFAPLLALESIDCRNWARCDGEPMLREGVCDLDDGLCNRGLSLQRRFVEPVEQKVKAEIPQGVLPDRLLVAETLTVAGPLRKKLSCGSDSA